MKTATLYIKTTSGEFDICLFERPVLKGSDYTIDIDTLVEIVVADIRHDFKECGMEIIDIVRVDGVEAGGAL